MDIDRRKTALTGFFAAALAAVDPERLTRAAVPAIRGTTTVIALGKAAGAMCRGAARKLENMHGLCVTQAGDRVPDGVELMVGDHPIPGPRSLAAGRRALEVADGAEGVLVALISGGGSALCEVPIEGVDPGFVREANERLLADGASIAEVNLVRRHLSRIKNGGLALRSKVPVATYVISDVCSADAGVVASGPTIHRPLDPQAAIATMSEHSIAIPEETRQAILDRVDESPPDGRVTVIGDGHTATAALVRDATAHGVVAKALDDWVGGEVEAALDRFLHAAGPGLTVAAGEPDVAVRGSGRGGRNTHTALLAASRIAGGDAIFAAFATDGEDGGSGSGGAIVDGQTVARGGDPGAALRAADSASYLEASGDLMVTGPTGTNVADIWCLWR